MKKISISFELPTVSMPHKIWPYFTDFSLRKLWETDLEEFTITGEMKSGVNGLFKLENMPAMKVVLSTVLINRELTERFDIPDIGALFFSHQIIEYSDNNYAIKSVIELEPKVELSNKVCYDFLKNISNDIIDKAFLLKELVEK